MPVTLCYQTANVKQTTNNNYYYFQLTTPNLHFSIIFHFIFSFFYPHTTIMQKSLMIIVLFACFAQALIAQEKTIKGMSKMPLKEFSKYEEKINIVKSSGEPYKMGQGQVAYYPALAIPKKVALINFYVYDQTLYQKWKGKSILV